MSKYIELNLEDGKPPVHQALETLNYYLSYYKKIKISCVLIIHGYGSSGSGGKIRTKVRKLLDLQLKEGIIKTVVYGERFDMFNEDARNLKSKYPELQYIYKQSNPGVTIVEI